MTQTKHKPAQITDLRVGAVVEVYRGNDVWERLEITNFSELDFAGDVWADHDDSIRIPLLTHDDILSCGFVYNRYFDSYYKGLFQLQWHKNMETHNFYVTWQGNQISFTIQTLLDLKDLMRLLNINQ